MGAIVGSLFSHQPNIFASPAVLAPALVAVERTGSVTMISLDYDSATDSRLFRLQFVDPHSGQRAGTSIIPRPENVIASSVPSVAGISRVEGVVARSETMLRKLWSFLPAQFRLPWRVCLESLYSYFEAYRSCLVTFGALTATSAHLNSIAVERLGLAVGGVFDRVSGGAWLSMHCGARWEVAASAIGLEQTGFWIICEWCWARTAVEGACSGGNILFPALACWSCRRYSSETQWVGNACIPPNVVPRVCIDDLMDLRLSGGNIYPYPGSVPHFRHAMQSVGMETSSIAENFFECSNVVAQNEMRVFDDCLAFLKFPFRLSECDEALSDSLWRSGWIYTLALGGIVLE